MINAEVEDFSRNIICREDKKIDASGSRGIESGRMTNLHLPDVRQHLSTEQRHHIQDIDNDMTAGTDECHDIRVMDMTSGIWIIWYPGHGQHDIQKCPKYKLCRVENRQQYRLQPKRLVQIGSYFRWEPLWRILSGAPGRFLNFMLEAEITSFL